MTTLAVNPDLIGPERVYWEPLCRRIRLFAEEYCPELDTEDTIRQVLARSILRDPRARLYLGLRDLALVGWAFATLEQTGPVKHVYSLAGQIDSLPGEDVAERYFQDLEAWGRAHGARYILHGTERNPLAWKRKYGFETVRTMMTRPIKDVSDRVEG